MPVQVYDSLGEILDAQRAQSAWTAFWGSMNTRAYLRPLRIAQIKALFDLSHGQYWLAYRGFHAALLVSAFVLFTRALRVRTPVDLAAAAFALTVLTGMATFRGTVQEAFPINHFLEMVVCCLLVLNLAQSRGGWWVDGLAVLAFAAAALTLESGLLVWVVAVAAWLAGYRGVSRRGLALMTALLAGYFYLRFVYLGAGTPSLSERSSGYLLSALDGDELQARFGARPAVFYAYNVASSMLTVLFSEPQSGVFAAVRSWLQEDVPPRIVLALVSSTLTTLVMAWAAIRSAGTWRVADDSGRLIAVFAAVLVSNAALSYAYTKDEVLSIAGAFYAIAAFAAVRLALERALMARAVLAAALAVVLLVAGTAWSVRSAGLHHILRLQAFRHRGDWAALPAASPAASQPADARDAELRERLRTAALWMRTPNPYFHPRWTDRVWGD